MEDFLIFNLDPFWQIAILLFLMFIALYVGTIVSKWEKWIESKSQGGSSILISAMFGLSAFLLAFTFSMSANRYDARRQIIVEEANDIGTAILRSDLYIDSVRNIFRAEFKNYVEIRIAYFEAGMDKNAIRRSLKAAEISSSKIWHLASEQSKIPSNLAASIQMIPAVNAMIDIVTTRYIGFLAKVPVSIVIMLYLISIACAFFAGVALNRIDWLTSAGFCLLTVMVIYITLDLDSPRKGFIQLTTSHRAMYDLRNMFK